VSRQRTPEDLVRFAREHEGVEAIVQRIGRDTFDLLLVDKDGNWTRGVFQSEEQCKQTAQELGIEAVHADWDDEALAKRMTRRDHWNEPGGQKRAL
jgi:hypothetical protein